MDKKKEKFFKKIVKEELNSMLGQEIIKESLSEKYKFHRHPIFTIIISFILTGIVGTGISYYIKDIEKEQTIKQEAFNHLNSFN